MLAKITSYQQMHDFIKLKGYKGRVKKDAKKILISLTGFGARKISKQK